jgi:haloacetate dehalogenase
LTNSSGRLGVFEGFKLEFIDVGDAVLRVRYGGSGLPVLLLHGHPRTHATWHRVAPLLGAEYTVVCPDLRGFGQSSKPVDTPDHAGSSKRAKAADCVALMHKLGFERFAIVGHDRGSYTAFRAAIDHPEAITHLAVLDGVPILEALERCDVGFASAWWHWFFFAQAEKPERAILANPELWYSGTPDRMGEEAYANFMAATRDPETIHGMLEDYRAGLGIDHSTTKRIGAPGAGCSVRRSRFGRCAMIWNSFTAMCSAFGDHGQHGSRDVAWTAVTTWRKKRRRNWPRNWAGF